MSLPVVLTGGSALDAVAQCYKVGRRVEIGLAALKSHACSSPPPAWPKIHRTWPS